MVLAVGLGGLAMVYAVKYKRVASKHREELVEFYAKNLDESKATPMFWAQAARLESKHGPVTSARIIKVNVALGFVPWAGTVEVERNGVKYTETIFGLPKMDGLESRLSQ